MYARTEHTNICVLKNILFIVVLKIVKNMYPKSYKSNKYISHMLIFLLILKYIWARANTIFSAKKLIDFC